MNKQDQPKEQKPAGLLYNYKSEEQVEFLRDMINIAKRNSLSKNKKRVKIQTTAKNKRRIKNKQARKVRKINRG